MTEPPFPLDTPDPTGRQADEYASAVLDGEPTDGAPPADLERRRLEFAHLAERVADVPGPPAGQADAQIAWALDEMDAAHGGSATARARSRWAMAGPLTAVAAAVLALVLLSTGVFEGTADDASQVAGADADQAGEADSLTTTRAEEAAAGEAPLSSVDHPDLDSLLDAHDRPDPERASASDGAGDEVFATAPDPCRAPSLLSMEDDVVAVRSASLRGRPVTVVVAESGGIRRFGVVDDETCESVFVGSR